MELQEIRDKKDELNRKVTELVHQFYGETNTVPQIVVNAKETKTYQGSVYAISVTTEIKF